MSAVTQYLWSVPADIGHTTDIRLRDPSSFIALGSNYSETASDFVSLAEAVSLTTSYSNSLVDLLSISESIGLQIDTLSNGSGLVDTVVLAESNSITQSTSSSVSDLVGLGELSSALLTSVGGSSLQDVASINELLVIQVGGSPTTTLLETALLGETTSFIVSHATQPIDLVILTETPPQTAVSLNTSTSDSLTLSEATTSGVNHTLVLIEAIALSESNQLQTTYAITCEESVSSTEMSSISANVSEETNEMLILDEIHIANLTNVIDATESLDIGETDSTQYTGYDEIEEYIGTAEEIDLNCSTPVYVKQYQDMWATVGRSRTSSRSKSKNNRVSMGFQKR